MKKIMFNDKYGLTDAVLEGRKTMTRRIVSQSVVDNYMYDTDPKIIDAARFDIGKVVAIAQSYRTIFEKSLGYALPRYHWLDDHIDEKGFANKMFVKAGEMPHHIKITDIKVERLQDISDEDCLREGIMEGDFMTGYRYYFDEWGDVPNHITFKTAREAFAELIDKVSGKGTWEKNPYVFVYKFILID